MKNTRKILVTLLAAALLFACFSFSVFADTELTPAEKYLAALEKNSKALEYYEAGAYLDMRVSEDGETVIKNVGDGFSFLKGALYNETVSDGAVKIQSLNPTKLMIDSEAIDSFGINAKLKLDAESSFSLFAEDTVTGDYLSLFSVSAGKVTHKFNTETLSYDEAALDLAADEYFTLAFFFEKGYGEDKVTLTVTPEGKEAVSLQYSIDNNLTDFLAGSFKTERAYVSVKSVTVGYLEIYPGSFARTLDNTYNTEFIANAIVDAYADYNLYVNNTSVADRGFGIAEIIAKIAAYHGFSYSELPDGELKNAVKIACDNSITAVAKKYSQTVANASAEIAKPATAKKAYNDRLDVVMSALVYDEFLTRLQNGEYSALGSDYETLNANLEVVRNEKATLDAIERDTLEAIAAALALPNVYIANYLEYETAHSVFERVSVCETYYSDEVSAETVLNASQIEKFVENEYPKLNSRAELFASSVPTACNESFAFGVRYSAYLTAKENLFTDSTYDKYLVGTTVNELLEDYYAIDAYMSEISDTAESFIAMIREASVTASYSVKGATLDLAKPYLSVVEPNYPGISLATDSYYAMREEIATRVENARRYIQAVLNIQLAKNVEDKASAIAVAERYAELGNDVSVEITDMKITVTEANKIFSNEKSAIVLEALRISNYVEAVNAIADAVTLAERRAAINKAYALKNNVNSEDEDVISATYELDLAIENYNSEVKAANEASESKSTAALTTLTKTVPTKRVAEIVAIIKKFYE